MGQEMISGGALYCARMLIALLIAMLTVAILHRLDKRL